jgi:hypothetical protein
VELGGFEQLGQLDPVVHVVEAPGLVVGVVPEAGRLVAATYFILSIYHFNVLLMRIACSLHISTKALRIRLLRVAIVIDRLSSDVLELLNCQIANEENVKSLKIESKILIFTYHSTSTSNDADKFPAVCLR